jgi:hypothetical protein
MEKQEMEIQLQVDLKIMSLTELKERLISTVNPSESGFTIETKVPEDIVFRGAVDPTILVAVVGAAGTALGALIGGLLKVAQQSGSKMIVVETRDGDRLEFPANFAPDQIDMLIKKVKALRTEKLSISIPLH